MRPAGIGVAALLLLSGPAYAHSPIPGIAGFYQGLLHPFSTPPQALLLIGLGLLAGGFEKDRARWMLLAFCAAMAVAMISGYGGVSDTFLYVVAILASTLAALSHKSLYLLAIISLFLGGSLIGCVSIPDGGLMRDRLIVMTGSFAGANLALLYVTGLVYIINDRVSLTWTPIGFRVAAAWIAALSGIMLAIQFAPAPTGTGT